jgi:hypothetical protein
MANSALQLTSLDFDTLKQNLKSFLSTQSIFKDYNFEGSNINTLLDVMSYNSYLNSFYLNMIASEMFLDSAQNLESVVSHAKELNYLPRSSKSSEANISFQVITSPNITTLTIKKGTLFGGTNANGAFNFVTDHDYSFTSSVSNSSSITYTVPNISVYEGKYITDTYVNNINNEAQRFILTNQNVDISSIEVIVTENNVNTNFSVASTLYNLTSTSNVFFLQAAQNNQYEIIFGDNNFGRIPNNLAVINISYRVTKGTDSDGVVSFICNQDLGVMNNGSASVQTPITVLANSSGGSNAESIDSIKFSAPRYFATQQRAVTSDDYSSLVLTNYGSIISDVNVYGGETLEPKQYGRVIVAIKPSGGTSAPDYVKNEISQFLKPFIALPNRVVITDPDYLYCQVNTTVQYNKNITTKSSSELQTVVLAAISQYSANNIEAFGSDLRYSKFISTIDNSDLSITSNDTSINIIKRLSPALNYPTSFSFSFNNPVEQEIASPGYVKGGAFSDEPVITSSAFTYVDSSGAQWPLSYIRDDNTGNLVVYSTVNGVFTILNSMIGTIDYTTGNVVITNLTTSYYNNYIALYVVPMNKDIVVSSNKILIIDPNDVTITMMQTVV